MNNRIKKSRTIPLFYFTVLFCLLNMMIMSFAVLFGYDPVMQLFKRESGIGVFGSWFLFVSLVCLFVLSVISFKGHNIKENKIRSLLGTGLSFVCGAVVLTSSLLMLIEATKLGSGEKFSMLLLAASIPTALYFVYIPFEDSYLKLCDIFGFFPPIWNAFLLLRIYFDKTAAINDPLRILCQISVVAVMLALLLELRFRLGKDVKFVYTFFASCAAVLGMSASVCTAILFFLPRLVSFPEFMMGMAQLALSVYALYRVYLTSKA